MKIGIVGEYYENFKPHSLLNQSLDWLKENEDFQYEWLDTLRVKDEGSKLLSQYSGIWSAPGSPFKSLDGALQAIKYARENNVPHLGTCAGLQHTIIEFARNVLGVADAQHEEYDSTSNTLFISRLACSLAGKTMSIRIEEGTLAHRCYQSTRSVEDYYCNFGINPEFKSRLNHPMLKISGIDQDNEIRIIEIPQNDFFLATLFVPQSRAKREHPHPIIKTFVQACLRRCAA